jgi:rod shape determining protein RodA
MGNKKGFRLNFSKQNMASVLKRYNLLLLFTVTILGVAGACFIRLAGGTDSGDRNFKKQIFGLLAGLVIGVFVSCIDYHLISRFVLLYYIIGTVMVAATRFSPLGTDVNTGSYRWLKLPGMNFQPSEVMKIILVLTLAVFLNRQEERMERFRTLIFAGLIMALPTGFVLVQSDLSSSLVMIFLFAIMVFAAGLSYKIVCTVLGISIPSFLIFFWYIQQPYQLLLEPYQLDRILGFLNPEKYSNSIMYQQNHSVQAIASGQLIGKAFMSTASNTRGYRYVDVNEADFIFSVIGEEVGFLGSCVIIGLLALVVILCVKAARKAYDRLGMLIAIGIAAMFMFQIFANIGVATSMLPNTGLPLPFLSAGLSSMVSSMIGIGLILNIDFQSTQRGRHSGFSML